MSQLMSKYSSQSLAHSKRQHSLIFRDTLQDPSGRLKLQMVLTPIFTVTFNFLVEHFICKSGT